MEQNLHENVQHIMLGLAESSSISSASNIIRVQIKAPNFSRQMQLKVLWIKMKAHIIIEMVGHKKTTKGLFCISFFFSFFLF